MKNIFLIIISLFIITSCEKEIDLDLDDKSGNIVIEGNVTNLAGPYYVKITKSVAFTENNNYPVITNATVVLSDNTGQTETLKYIGEGLYETIAFSATAGRTYTLKVTAEGKEYTAKSKMPEPVLLEDLQQDSFLVAGELSYTLLPIFTDPPVLGNRYLFNYTVNNSGKTFEAFSDNVNNGLVNQRPLLLPNDDDGDGEKTKVGDTIYVEMQCIDTDVYTYFTSLLQIIDGGGPGGGITPSNPPSNISNGALGYFSAHTISKKNYVIK